MCREKTAKEVREEFMEHMKHLCRYWARAEVESELERCEGLMHSVLVTFDGCSAALPALDIVVRPHPDDKEFHQSEGSDWYPDGVAINDDCHLHDLLYRKEG